jgi:hypothetical protein
LPFSNNLNFNQEKTNDPIIIFENNDNMSNNTINYQQNHQRNLQFSIPSISNTHDNAVSNHMICSQINAYGVDSSVDINLFQSEKNKKTINKAGNINLDLLSLLGYSSKVSRERSKRETREQRVKEKEVNYLKQFPSLKDLDVNVGSFQNEEIVLYKEKLQL